MSPAPTPRSYSLPQRLTLFVVPRAASLLIRLLGMTLRYEDIFAPGATSNYHRTTPTIHAFWHRSLLACAWHFRNRNIAILISQSFDGELIARTVGRLGFTAIRGSSSFGGAAGLRNMADAYNRGLHCALTADGPRGPAMIAKPGPLQLAALVDAPAIGAFYALPLRAWELRSWDRFLIPKPFSRVLIAWPPMLPCSDFSPSALQQLLDRSVALASPTRR